MKNRFIYLGVLTALAMIASYIEVLLPFSVGIAGIKLGLANIVVVITLYVLGEKEAFLVSFVRIFLMGFLFGNMAGILYSLAGGMLSLAVMIVLFRLRKFSVSGVSIAGGVSHNIGQLTVAVFIVSNLKLLYYLPVLLCAGIVTGLLIGILTREILRRLPRNLYDGKGSANL